MGFLADDLIASVRRRASVPAAQNAFTAADILALADEETRNTIVPLIMSVREDYYLYDYDYTTSAGTLTYRFPARAVGSKLREVAKITGSGVTQVTSRLPRVAHENIATAYDGFYVKGNTLTLTQDPASTTLRLTYCIRPNALVLQAEAGLILTVNSSTKVVTLNNAPATFTNGVTYDFVRGRPGFEHLAIDASASISGGTMTFSAALPADLQAGDYVCLSEETPIPQMPVELHSVLAERVALRIMEGQGNSEALDNVRASYEEMKQNALTLITPRVDASPTKLANYGSLVRGFPW